jgi:hypothetical protein
MTEQELDLMARQQDGRRRQRQRAERAEARVAELEAERRVIRCAITLYGSRLLYKALDDAGISPTRTDDG